MAAFIFYFNYLTKAAASSDSTKSVFNITEGDSTYLIAAKLHDDGYTKSVWAFYAYVKIKELTIKSGSYLVSPNMSTADIAGKIASGETAIRKVTIPEGYRNEQIAQLLDKKGYIKYADFMAAADGDEGKLFPDTYYISIKSTAADVVEMMKKDYADQTAGLNVSGNDLILASIIEREAKNDTDRTAISGVYTNRLKINMKLEADPTVLFANDNKQIVNLSPDQVNKFSFWKTIPFANYLLINSPYNTYTTAGLPPGPICNPGLKSIKAAQNPDSSSYYYFFHDTNGQIYLSKTAAEHSAKQAQVLK